MHFSRFFVSEKLTVISRIPSNLVCTQPRSMLLISVSLSCGIRSILGALAHQTLFIHGECHILAPELLIFHSGLFITLLAGWSFFDNATYGPLMKALNCVAYFYVLTLLGSIVLYRIFFHPLTKAGFRGQWYARVTKLWHVWAARNSKNHLVLDQLHHEYGDFVRTGRPNAHTAPSPSPPQQGASEVTNFYSRAGRDNSVSPRDIHGPRRPAARMRQVRVVRSSASFPVPCVS